MNEPSARSYADLLGPWVQNARQYLYTCPDRPELMCYGTGYNTWGVQTNQKAFSAFAAAALEPDCPLGGTLTRETVRDQALAMLRFSLQTHIEGDYTCTDGQKWGHTWISVLGVERMMHAVDALDSALTDADRALLRRVLLSEAGWLLEEYPIHANLLARSGHNRPESNIWNGALLCRTAQMYPDAPDAARYREKGVRFLLNGISTESDAASAALCDGTQISKVLEGANYFDSLALDHHGYLNVGYMVICLSNIAMLHFFYKRRGVKPPEALYHHARALWRLVRTFSFDDGRLNRIGGDSRARYCYCQDYALPMWLLAEDAFGEDCAGLENGWLDILRTETAYNADGSFLSARCGHMRATSPLYYTRLESDRANCVALAALWRREFGIAGGTASETLPAWEGPYHGASYCRGAKRAASFVWRSAEPTQGMCLPLQDSSLAEWRHNLSGAIRGLGGIQREEVLAHAQAAFPGGFLTWGKTRCVSTNFLAEGQAEDHQAVKFLAFAALPDDATVLCIQRAVAENRTVIQSYKSLLLNIPNDVFNAHARRYAGETGEAVVHGSERGREGTLPAGRWICVDGKLGAAVPQGQSLLLCRPGRRNIPLINQGRDTRDDDGTLYCDELCANAHHGNRWYDRGEEIFVTSFAVAVGSQEQIRALCEGLTVLSLPEGVLSVAARGRDGVDYALLYNLSGAPYDFIAGGWAVVSGTEMTNGTLHLEEGGACLLRREG